MSVETPRGSAYHVPVLPEDVVRLLVPRPGAGGLFIDATVGGGGHAARILAAAGPATRLIGLDRDQEALDETARRLAPEIAAGRLVLAHGSFASLDETLSGLGIPAGSADGVLLDLGVSSHQLDDAGRGFSFTADGPLDMRMDRSQGPGQGPVQREARDQGRLTAAALINRLGHGELARVLREFGEERNSGRIAKEILARREKTPFATTRQLVEAVLAAFGGRERIGRIHVATRTFQALRIAVNEELDQLKHALPLAFAALKPGGRMAVISFHSLEDRIVKHTMRDWATGCICPREVPVCVCGRTPRVRLITRKGLKAPDLESAANPRARSAILRAVEREASSGGRPSAKGGGA